MAKYGLLLCEDGSNNEVMFEPLPRNYFASVGLPEKRIEEEMKKRIAMDLWIAEHGWLGVFKHALRHGVLRVDAGQEDPLEGLLSSTSACYPIHAAVAERVLAPPWAAAVARVRLAKKPLFITFDNAELAAIDEESKSSWLRWFGAGTWAPSSLANALHRKHDISFQIGAPAYHPEELGCPEADQHFERCLGTTARVNAFAVGRRVEARWEGGKEWYPGKIKAVCDGGAYAIHYDDGEDEEGVAEGLIRVLDGDDDAGDPELHEELDEEEKGLADAALDAAEVPRDSLLRQAAKAFARAVPRLCSTAAGDVVSGSEAAPEAADAATGASEDDERFKSCLALMRSGALDAVKGKHGTRPCSKCMEAFRNEAAACKGCTKMERRPVPGSRSGTRPRAPPGSTPNFVGVMACNECMDVATGLRTDGGTTCLPCFKAVYEDGHATIGGEPFGRCLRKQQSRKDSALVTSLKQKLEKLRRQRAVGNRE